MRRLEVSPRPDWRATAREEGFHFFHLDGQDYWDEGACFAFSLDEIEGEIEAPSAELHGICLDLVGEAAGDETILHRLGIPEAYFDVVARSWRDREPTVTGRFDLAYDGTGPAKLLEYNADTPTGLYEAAVFQWKWLEDAKRLGIVPDASDQFNSLHERLIEAYGHLAKGSLLHFTCDRTSIEDFGTLAYMMDCATQGGQRVKFLDLKEIGRDAQGRFSDQDDLVIDVLTKLYPWEWLFADEFGPLIANAGTRFIEPAWKAALSTKAILPLLWERHPGHPNLLPAFFEEDGRAGELTRYVRKPIFSREGANTTLVEVGTDIASTGGLYGREGYVIQETARLFTSPHGHAVTGSWIIAGQPGGIGMREDISPITGNMSRFIPHLISSVAP